MAKQSQTQTKQIFEQWKLEVQNKELQTQIQHANNTIAAQNQYITELYSTGGWLLGILSLWVVVFGIVIPIVLTFLAGKKLHDFEQKTKEVDKFIKDKLTEWENQGIDKALDKYLKGEINWIAFTTFLKFEPMSFEHMKKILDFAKDKGNRSLDKFYDHIYLLVSYLFEEKKDYKSDDFEKMRKLIIDCEYFYTLGLNPHRIHYINILKSLSFDEQQEKILSLLKNAERSDNNTFYSAIVTVIDGNFLSTEVEKIIADNIIKRKHSVSLSKVQNTQNIINRLEKEKFFDEIKHSIAFEILGEILDKLHDNQIQLYLNDEAFHIDKDSNLAKRLQEYKKANEQEINI